jgi:hypothetical protein
MKIYKYNDYEYKDEAGEFTTADVKQQLTQYFPEIANCVTEEKQQGADTVVTFVKRAGTKGQGDGVTGREGERMPVFLRVGDDRWINLSNVLDINAECVVPDCITLDGATRVVLCGAESEAFLAWLTDHDWDIRDYNEPAAPAQAHDPA